jgi:predicted RNase H-like nuclease (RuvC/YqgF family)
VASNRILKPQEVDVELLKCRISELEAVEDAAAKRIAHLEQENNDLQGALNRSVKIAEGLGKDVESARRETGLLREDLARTLGYIDRVNEDAGPMPPISVTPAQPHLAVRGPQIRIDGRTG